MIHDDEDESLRNLILEQHGDHYKSHNIDTWWLDLPDQKYYVEKFLSVLCVNPVWDLGYRKRHTVTDFSKHYFPCYCPCHRQFKPYFDRMNNSFLADDEKNMNVKEVLSLPNRDSRHISTTLITGAILC